MQHDETINDQPVYAFASYGDNRDFADGHIFTGYSDAARYYGCSRQNIQQWLERTGRLDQCQKIPVGKRILAVKIPAYLLDDAPFAGAPHSPRPGRPKKQK